MNPEAKDELVIEPHFCGRGAKCTLTVKIGERVLHHDTVDLAKQKDRERFVEELTKARPGIDGGAVNRELLRLAADRAAAGKGPQSATSADSPTLYRATDNGLVWDKRTKDGLVPTRLTNFVAEIVADVTYDDGAETHHTFELEACLNGHKRRLVIPASQFGGMTWVPDRLGAGAIVHAGFGTKDHARAAIQTLSRNVEERTVYTHTGWRKLGEVWAYLHGGGAIGPDGTVPGIEVELPKGLSHYVLPTPPGPGDLGDSIRASVRLLDVAPEVVTIPLFCTIWRVVLDPCDFSVHVAGQTGTGKNELAALAQRHFGPGMDARHLPASWSSTANALEGLVPDHK